MAPTNPHVTEAELAVLQALWTLGLATIRDLRDQIYPDGTVSEYATVQKLLERLEQKNLVKRSRRSKPHTFAARIDREQLLGHRLQDLAETLGGGSIAPIVSSLVNSRDLKPQEREQLRLLAERLTQKSSRGTGK